MTDDVFQRQDAQLARLKSAAAFDVFGQALQPRVKPSGLEVYRVHCSSPNGDRSILEFAETQAEAEDQARQWARVHGFTWTVISAEKL